MTVIKIITEIIILQPINSHLLNCALPMYIVHLKAVLHCFGIVQLLLPKLLKLNNICDLNTNYALLQLVRNSMSQWGES